MPCRKLLPAINDVTADEMRDILRRAAYMCEIVSTAIARVMARNLETYQMPSGS